MSFKSDFKDEGAFRKAVETVLEQLVEQIDDVEFDAFEPQLTAGGLSISFDDGAVFLLSRQTPTKEIWLSANFTAWHFFRKKGEWIERDSHEPMLAVLGGLLSEKFGEEVRLHL